MSTLDLDCIRQIMADQPELTDFGFGAFNERSLSAEERAANMAANRAEMLLPRSVEQFGLARQWLRSWPKTKHPNPNAGTSYGLKHRAEKAVGYVTNGMFIAAAYAEGFKVKRLPANPNALFNISIKARR